MTLRLLAYRWSSLWAVISRLRTWRSPCITPKLLRGCRTRSKLGNFLGIRSPLESLCCRYESLRLVAGSLSGFLSVTVRVCTTTGSISGLAFMSPGCAWISALIFVCWCLAYERSSFTGLSIGVSSHISSSQIEWSIDGLVISVGIGSDRCLMWRIRGWGERSIREVFKWWKSHCVYLKHQTICCER